MGTNLKFNSAICTSREQSERLIALGLRKETADMMFIVLVKDFHGKDIPVAERVYSLCTWYNETSMRVGLEKREYIPAWSLDRLLKMIPEWISYPTQFDSAPLRINKDSMYYLHRFFDRNGDEDTSTVGDDEAIGSHNIYDYAVSVIGFLIREGYFCKEYLED